MGIHERLMHQEEPPLPVHYVYSAIWEFAAGRVTAAQIKTAFGLNASESAELDTLLATVTGNLAAKAQRCNEIQCVWMLGEGRYIYATAAAVKTALGV